MMMLTPNSNVVKGAELFCSFNNLAYFSALLWLDYAIIQHFNYPKMGTLKNHCFWIVTGAFWMLRVSILDRFYGQFIQYSNLKKVRVYGIIISNAGGLILCRNQFPTKKETR